MRPVLCHALPCDALAGGIGLNNRGSLRCSAALVDSAAPRDGVERQPHLLQRYARTRQRPLLLSLLLTVLLDYSSAKTRRREIAICLAPHRTVQQDSPICQPCLPSRRPSRIHTSHCTTMCRLSLGAWIADLPLPPSCQRPTRLVTLVRRVLYLSEHAGRKVPRADRIHDWRLERARRQSAVWSVRVRAISAKCGKHRAWRK